MSKMLVVVGPNDHGRRMSLEDFDHAEVTPGYQYELGRGAITVSDVPKKKHLAQVNALRRMLAAYDLAHPKAIHTIAGSGECKLLLWDMESERHPDLAIYKAAPPEGEEIWATWIPELAIEVVSPGSETRDYEEKPPEYLRFGVSEYWIVDAVKEEVFVLRKSGSTWTPRTLKADALYKTRLLPGFELDVAKVFQAARQA